MIDEAVRRHHAAQDDRYLAGVLASLAWVAGIVDNDPVTQQHRPATPDAQLDVRIAVDAIRLGVQDPIFGISDLHPHWAIGVARALDWVMGPDPAAGRPQLPPPLQLPRSLSHNT